MPPTKASYDALCNNPGYWRGRAQARLQFAAELHPTAWPDRQRHLQTAAELERAAHLLELLRRPAREKDRNPPTNPPSKEEPPLAYFRPQIVGGDGA